MTGTIRTVKRGQPGKNVRQHRALRKSPGRLADLILPLNRRQRRAFPATEQQSQRELKRDRRRRPFRIERDDAQSATATQA